MSFGALKQWIVFNLKFVFNLQNGSAKYRADYFKVFSPKYQTSLDKTFQGQANNVAQSVQRQGQRKKCNNDTNLKKMTSTNLI